MLGSNDVAPTFKLTTGEIAFGCASLIWTVQRAHAGPDGGVPQILLIAPPAIERLTDVMALFFGGAEHASRQLPAAYATGAAANNCHFLDASQLVKAAEPDGIRLDPDGQRVLGLGVAHFVAPLLARD
jgi:lysophospholipase L1-like esterase